MIVMFQRSITVRVRRMKMILAVVSAVVPSVTYDQYVSEGYYSESEENFHSSSGCSTPSEL